MSYDMASVQAAYLSLAKLAKLDLNEQYEKNRIKGTEYADVYSKLMNTCLTLAMEAPLKGAQVDGLEKDLLVKDAQAENLLKDIEVKTKQMEVFTKDIEVKEEQKNLYIRQNQGFDDDLRRKMLDIQMNTWAMMFSSGLLDEKPAIISNDEVSELYCYMKEQVLESPCTPTTLADLNTPAPVVVP